MWQVLKKKIIKRKRKLLKFVRETKLLCQRAERGEFDNAEDLLREYFKIWPLLGHHLKEKTIKRKIKRFIIPSYDDLNYTIKLIEDAVVSNIIRGRLKEINWLLKNL
ncbi:MAG: hypothetical protein V1892_03275 [bacterium]